MSGFVAGAVWNTPMPDRTMKIVLASLGDNASDDGFAWPSIKLIAERTMYSKRSVIATLAALEEQCWISKEQHPEFHRRHAYRLNFDKLRFSKPESSYRRRPVPQTGNSGKPAETAPSQGSLTLANTSTVLSDGESQVQPLHLTAESQVQSTTGLRCNPRHSQVQSTTSYIRKNRQEPSHEPARASDAPPPVPVRPPAPPSSLAKPVNPPAVDLEELACEIVCAHPRARQRSWTAADVPWSDKGEAWAAMRAEAERAGCSEADAGRMILDLVNGITAAVPEPEWRFFKPVLKFFQEREYRLPPDAFRRSAVGSSAAPAPQGKRLSIAEKLRQQAQREVA